MKKQIFFFFLFLFVISTYNSTDAQANPVTEITFMALELWPDFDQPELLVIHSMLLPPQQTYPATVHYTLPASARLHTVAHFDQNQQSLSDTVTYQQDGETVIIEATRGGLRLEYYLPYDTAGSTHIVDFVWQSNFTADLLQISVQQPRYAEEFSLNADILESRLTDNELRYYILPPRDITKGETVSLSFMYDLPDDRLSAPSTAEQVPQSVPESTIGNNLLNNLPFVGLALLLLLIAVIFLRQGLRDRQVGNMSTKQTCSHCGQENHGHDKFCRQCGEPL